MHRPEIDIGIKYPYELSVRMAVIELVIDVIRLEVVRKTFKDTVVLYSPLCMYTKFWLRGTHTLHNIHTIALR